MKLILSIYNFTTTLLLRRLDSSEMAFRTAARDAFKETVPLAKPKILEPVMRVDVEAPEEFQGVIVGGLNRRKGIIQNTGTLQIKN